MEAKFNEGQPVFYAGENGEIERAIFVEYQRGNLNEPIIIVTDGDCTFSAKDFFNAFATELEAIQWLKAKAKQNEDEYYQRNSNGNDHD